MYKIILENMGNFKDGEKGIFLTNTRHAYKHVAMPDGKLYWNCGTFFNQWHPGKTYSIRIHNVTLKIESQSDKKELSSTEGLDRYVYSWAKIENGLWDKAFELNGNKPVAIPLKSNVFGQSVYMGNNMTKVKKEQTMYDAYDAVIFLKPLNELHFSAETNFFYTPEFLPELK